MAVLAAVCCVGSAFLVVARSGKFTVAQFHLHGTSRSAQSLGLDRYLGESLLTVSTTDVQDALMQTPWIASAEVARTFPDALTINVLETQTAYVQQFGGKFWLVDDKGHPFKRAVVSQGEAAGLPVVVSTGEGQMDAASPIRYLRMYEASRGGLPPVDTLEMWGGGLTIWTKQQGPAIYMSRALASNDFAGAIQNASRVWQSGKANARIGAVYVHGETRAEKVVLTRAEGQG